MVEEKNNKLRIQGQQKRPGVCVIRIIEVKEKECGAEKVFEEIISKNFTNMAKDKPTHSRSSVNT